jgi:hypothetical protein
MRTSLILLALAAVAAVATAMTPHSAQGDRVRTLRFTAPAPPPRDFRQVDLPPRGLSLGDEFVGAVSLRRGGHLAGRALSECTITDASFEGQHCSLDLVLRDGLITAETAGLDRPLPGQHLSPNDVFAVTGGTGAHIGAEGTVTIIAGPPPNTFVVRLLD